MSRIGMNMLASKGNAPDVQNVDIYFYKPGGLGKQKKKAVALHLLHQYEDLATMILLSKAAAGFAFGVAERLSRTFKAESTGLHAEAPKMLWADSVSTAYLIYHIPYVPIGLRILEEEWRGKDTSLAHLKEATQMKCDTVFEIRRVTRLSEAEILPLWTRFMEPGWSSVTSEGSENSGSFEDSQRSDEEDSKYGASSKEGGSKTPRVRRSNRESKAPVRYSSPANYLLVTENGELESYSEALRKKASQSLWMFKVREEQNNSERYEAPLSIVAAGAFLCTESTVDDMLVVGSDMAKLNKHSWNEEPCRDVHQVGDEREVEVLRSFNWPPSELIKEYGVLPEREIIPSLMIKVRAVALLKGQRLLETESSEVVSLQVADC
ncbi:hypothetical protein Tco_0690942 [Tanacetum coccineum]